MKKLILPKFAAGFLAGIAFLCLIVLGLRWFEKEFDFEDGLIYRDIVSKLTDMLIRGAESDEIINSFIPGVREFVLVGDHNENGVNKSQTVPPVRRFLYYDDSHSEVFWATINDNNRMTSFVVVDRYDGKCTYKDLRLLEDQR